MTFVKFFSVFGIIAVSLNFNPSCAQGRPIPDYLFQTPKDLVEVTFADYAGIYDSFENCVDQSPDIYKMSRMCASIEQRMQDAQMSAFITVVSANETAKRAHLPFDTLCGHYIEDGLTKGNFSSKNITTMLYLGEWKKVASPLYRDKPATSLSRALYDAVLSESACKK